MNIPFILLRSSGQIMNIADLSSFCSNNVLILNEQIRALKEDIRSDMQLSISQFQEIKNLMKQLRKINELNNRDQYNYLFSMKKKMLNDVTNFERDVQEKRDRLDQLERDRNALLEIIMSNADIQTEILTEINAYGQDQLRSVSRRRNI